MFVALLALHLSGLVALFNISTEFTKLSLLLLPLIVFSLYYNLRRYVFFSGNNIVTALMRDAYGDWSVVIDKETYSEKLMSDLFVGSFFVLLKFSVKEIGSRITVIVMADAVDNDVYRQLKVILRVTKAEVRNYAD